MFSMLPYIKLVGSCDIHPRLLVLFFSGIISNIVDGFFPVNCFRAINNDIIQGIRLYCLYS